MKQTFVNPDTGDRVELDSTLRLGIRNYRAEGYVLESELPNDFEAVEAPESDDPPSVDPVTPVGGGDDSGGPQGDSGDGSGDDSGE